MHGYYGVKMEKINYIVKTVSGCVSTSFPLTEFHEDRKLVSRDRFNNQKQFIASDILDDDVSKVRTIVSDQEKFILTMEPSMYHTIVDSIGSTLYWIKRHPNALFIIDMYFIYENEQRWHLMHGLFIDILDKSGVDYRLVNLYKDKLILNNFHIVTDQDYFPNERLKLVNDFVKTYVSDPDVKPHRKIYISRKNSRSYFLWDNQELKPGATYKNDVRIHGEDILENYFSSLGYEIMYAERFIDVREQIETFYAAKSVISPSGSGLTNTIFMQPGSNVLEITTPIGAIFPEGFHYSITDEVKNSQAEWLFEYHHIYKEIANALGHNYISLQTDKNPRTITRFLDERPYMRDMLRDNW